ncbi:hypothetical protein H312_03376 [Anncaliia algerae PRA339]|uniref:Sm domain-containing protein n=1 Tax=Anncaliia algerae PRA339 TaxID=1288291 RepID=A0A059EWV7_9MICR|nr:hypothetical protein H312_03376 [Anncaliia algerae PRA339]
MKEDEKKQHIFVELDNYKNKVVTVKLLTGQHISGVLDSFDKVPNIVLSKIKDEEWEYGEKIICLGHSIVSIALGKPIF